MADNNSATISASVFTLAAGGLSLDLWDPIFSIKVAHGFKYCKIWSGIYWIQQKPKIWIF